MANQTSYNNKASSNVVQFRNYIARSVESGDCCFTVVSSADQLGLIQDPEVDHIAVIWNKVSVSPEYVPSIAIYLGNGTWAIKSLKGERGARGEDGHDGQDGQDGQDGDKGDKGDKGDPGFSPGHRWDGTKLQFQNPNGTWGTLIDLKGEKGEKGAKGDNGAKGDKPAHSWLNSQLRFEKPDGTWGLYVDLKGDKGDKGDRGDRGEDGEDGRPPAHEIDAENFRFRFETENGTWGEWIVYGSSMVSRVGILDILINDSPGNTLSVDKLVNSMATFTVSSLLHVTILSQPGYSPVEEGEDPYYEYNKIPQKVEKWWWRKSGEATLGEDGQATQFDDFFCYYANHPLSPVPMRLLSGSIPLDDSGTFYKDMAYMETGVPEHGKESLKDLLIATERAVITNMMHSIKLRFSWGLSGNLGYDEAIDKARLWGIDHLANNYTTLVAGTYPVLYPEAPHGILICNQLKIYIPHFGKIEGKSPVLLIDRYRKKRKLNAQGDTEPRFKSSGYTHMSRADAEGNDEVPLYRIPIDKQTMILDDSNFNQHRLFTPYAYPQGNELPFIKDDFSFRARGAAKSNPNMVSNTVGGSMAQVKLRFRIQWCNTDNKGRKKIFKTVDSGQLSVHVVRFTDLGDEIANIDLSQPNKKTAIRRLTYKIV